MNQPRPADDDALFARIADRYALQRSLGRGGMAAVYEVIERSSGRRLALKRLSITESAQDRAHLALLFEQEFHTLSQLAHPRVVRVHDFVRLDDEAFYTMELLDGGDLIELAPLPWQRVCGLLIDVCSALALLHSRSLVHRDLTPRNVRCTTEGTAKLIDFGAMLRFGPAKRLVGTPSYIAPEALDGQPLDGRADLFALGATAYYALTGQHAFPARNMAAVRDAHAFRPLPPSAIVEDIPASLDQLVMALLQLSPLARPSSAGEVMERLSVIAGQPIDEQLAIRSAYLSSPSLVGRDAALGRARKHAERAMQGQGSSVLVSGPPGVGRTRFVEACTLEAKLMGACVLRANAADGNAGDFGGATALAEQLLDNMPEIALQHAALDAAVLAHVVPRLSAGLAQTTPDAAPLRLAHFASAVEKRARMQTALRDWIKRVAQERCLVIAVDDFHQLDEPSCALVAILAHEARSSRLLIVVSADSSDTTPGKEALRLLGLVARSIRLKPLELVDSEALLLSVFGDVPNVRLIAHRLHEFAHGNPRELMQLAQHLVTERVIGYAAGVWSLPPELRQVDLPQSALDALSGRIPKLSDAARMLAQSMALCRRRALSLQDCVVLAGSEVAPVLDSLDALIAADIIANDTDRYRLTSTSWQRALTQDLSAEQAQQLHARLANLPWSGEHERFQAVQHLWRAGASAQALQLMLAHATAVEERYNTDNDWFYEYVRMLPSDWLETCEGLLATAKALHMPKRDQFALIAHSVGCAPAAGRSCPDLIRECAQLLYVASGLSCYDELGTDGDPATRLTRALTLAQERYDQLPDHERVLPVGDAIPRVARCVLHAIATVGRSSDYALLASMPSLKAYAPLSPLLVAIQSNAEATLHALGGRFDRARAGYMTIKQTLEQTGDVNDVRRQHMMYMAVMYAIGAIETGVGIEGGERWAERIAGEPLLEVNAWRLRLMAALRQGDFDKAQQLRQKLELIRIQNSPPQLFEGTLLWVEALCYSMSDDLARVKQVIPSIEAMTSELPKWQPFLHYARGQYQRMRGDQTQALREFETGLKLVSAGQHMSWAALAGAYVWGLHVTGQAEQAIEAGKRLFAEAEANGLHAASQPILQSLALAQAARGDFESALANARLSVAVVEGVGTSGIVLASTFETLARIAVLMKDRAAFDQHAARCAQLYRAGNNPSLTAKYERLLYDARATLGDGKERLRSGERTEQRLQSAVSTALRGCQDLESRAKQTLQLLLEHTECTGGYLYILERDGLRLRAEHGSQPPPRDMDELATAHVAAQLDDAEDVTATGDGDTGLSTMWASLEGRYVPLLLAHTGEQGRLVTGLALLYVSADQMFTGPGALVPVLSRALVEAGDVVSSLAPY